MTIVSVSQSSDIGATSERVKVIEVLSGVRK
jgi:hypothetical protein